MDDGTGAGSETIRTRLEAFKELIER
jgi:hypothetical protein